MRKKRSSIVDILKAIGIISVVIGHAGATLPNTSFQITKFVYSFHLMLFIFVIGFLFKEKATTPQHIGKTLINTGKYYITYNFLAVLGHNLFIEHNLWWGDKYGALDILTKSLQGIAFTCSESLLGAFWFIPYYIMTNVIFIIVFKFAEKRKFSIIWHVFCCFLCGVIGLFLCWKNVYITFRVQTSILSVPIVYLGVFVKKYWDKIQKYLFSVLILILGISLYFIVKGNEMVALNKNMISSPWLFYPLTVLGISFCLVLANFLDKFKYTRKIFSYIGKNSFHIMALHLICIKLVDVIYGNIINASATVIAKSPYAFNLQYIYYIVGVGLPLLIIQLLRWGEKYLKFIFKKIKAKKNRAILQTEGIIDPLTEDNIN